jgi:uncharacterized membrane protein YjfL (UPF0719 family)
MNQVLEMLQLILGLGIIALTALALIYAAKKITDFKVRKVYNADYEIEVAENTAVSLRRGGLYIALAIGFSGALGGFSIDGFKAVFLTLVFEGALMIVFLGAAMYINDKFLLSGIDNDQALKNNNISVGLFEMGAYIGTGLIALGSFAGSGPWYSSIVFFVLGQIMLFAMVKTYEYFSKYDVLKEIKNGNIPAGLMAGGTMVAYGYILKASIIGPFYGWKEDLIETGISAFSCILLLVVVNKVNDKLFLPNTSIRKEIEVDKDLAPIIVAVALLLASAIIIGPLAL